MSRRVRLPGASELFRPTGDEASANGAERPARGSGRVRHDEKITVYVSRESCWRWSRPADAAGRARHGRRPGPHGPGGDRGALADSSRPARSRAGAAAVGVVTVLPDSEAAPDGGFEVHLTNFAGPFDLLLQLIARHKLDVTEVALSRVTDEFIAHIKAAGATGTWSRPASSSWWRPRCSTSRPRGCCRRGEIDDAEDLALLEARDLLFARLLQYRAYKQVAGLPGATGWPSQDAPPPAAGRPRAAVRRLLPEVRLDVTPGAFAALAAKAMAPRQADVISLAHLHAPAVSVREQAALVVDRLRRAGTLTFRALAGRRPGPGDHGRPVPGPAGAVQGGRRGLRAADPAGRADHPLDRDPTPATWPSPTSSTSPDDQVRPAPEERSPEERTARGKESMTDQSDADCSEVSGALEALLLLADEPVRGGRAGPGGRACRSGWSTDALAELVAFYDETGRGLRAAPGRRRLALLHPRGARRPDQRLPAGRSAGQAVAGRPGDPGGGRVPQPISRGRISAIRGVNVDGVVRTLLARGLITEAGHDAESGRGHCSPPRLLPGADGAARSWTSCRRWRRTCPRPPSWRPS